MVVGCLGLGFLAEPGAAESQESRRYDAAQTPLACWTGDDLVLLGVCWGEEEGLQLGGAGFYPAGRMPLRVEVVDDVTGSFVPFIVCQDQNFDAWCEFGPEPFAKSCGVGVQNLDGLGFDNWGPVNVFVSNPMYPFPIPVSASLGGLGWAACGAATSGMITISWADSP